MNNQTYHINKETTNQDRNEDVDSEESKENESNIIDNSQ